MELYEKLKNLPQQSGVYIFRDEFSRILYVGKASNLRNRVRQYFQSPGGESPRRLRLRSLIRDLDYIITSSGVEALITEAQLIKRYRPPFNVTMRDDKAYTSIEITVYEDFPRMRVVRRPENRRSRYFGPFTSSGAMRRIFKLIQKAFLIRTCRYDLKKPLPRPCLDFHINLCPAPCVGNIGKGEYQELVKRACSFLDGRTGDLEKYLRAEIERRSGNLEFERCALLRDLLGTVELISSRRPSVAKPGEDGDILGISSAGDLSAVVLIQVRDGKILSQQQQIFHSVLESDESEILLSFIQNHYRRGFFIPEQIFLPVEIESAEDVAGYLSDLRKKKVALRTPRRGIWKNLSEMAGVNAADKLKSYRKVSGERLEKNRRALENLAEILNLSETPRRIEGYDISNISGEMAVASMVVFLDGEPYKEHYRRFKIRLSEGPDDFAMMGEALERRLRNLSAGEAESFRESPDLILIDGGKGQLSSAVESAEKAGFENLAIISLAKREEEIFVPRRREPLKEAADSPALMLLQRVRDEAHRFAVTYHRNLRKKRIEVSILDGISGISQKRKEALLRHFDSIEDISRATLYEIEALPGFNRKVAENVLRYLGESRRENGENA